MNLKKRYFQLSLCALCATGPLSSAEAPETGGTLEALLAAVIEAHPGLEQFSARAEAAESHARRAQALPDPRASVAVFGQAIETRTGPQRALYSLQQTFPWKGKRKHAAGQALDEAEQYHHARESQGRALREAVRTHFYEITYLRRALATTAGHRLLIEDLRPVIEARVRGGESANALLRLEVEMERVRDRETQLRQAHASERARLAALLLLDEAVLPPLAEDPPAPPPWSFPDASSRLRTHPDLRALSAGVSRARHGMELAALERRPDIALGLNYVTVDASDSTHPDAGNDPWSVSVAVNLPLWRGKNKATEAAARATVRAAEARLQERRWQLQAALDAALTKQEEAAERLERYTQRLLPLAEQALENSRTAYEGGQLSVLELIDSERSLLDLRLGRERAIADLAIARARLLALLGEETE